MVTGLDGGFREAGVVPVLGQRVLRPRQQVEDALRKAVLGGVLRTGERLPAEAELARQFSVSRPTIREALSALETQGLIRKVPGAGGGSFVQAVDHESMGVTLSESMHNLMRLGSLTFDEVAMARQFLEVPSAALAAVNRSEEDVAELRKIVSEQKARSVDDPAVPELDAQFHSAIARMSGNRVLASLVYCAAPGVGAGELPGPVAGGGTQDGVAAPADRQGDRGRGQRRSGGRDHRAPHLPPRTHQSPRRTGELGASQLVTRQSCVQVTALLCAY